MRTFRRVLVIALVAVVVLTVVAWVGGRAFLNSSRARAIAADRLSGVLGMPVEVDGLSVGAGSSTIGFRVLQPTSAGQPPAEVLKVDSATADVSLGDLIRQTVAPTELTLHGVSLTLHFDRDGRLLTKLPKSEGGTGEAKIPTVRLDGGTLTIAQEGRPPFVMSGISATVTPADGRLTIAGTVNDPRWGEWAVGGAVDPKTAVSSAELKTAAGRLDMELLRSIPFVPDTTWQHVRATGTSPARVTLGVGADDKFAYLVELTPAGAAAVEVPDIEATVAGVAGVVRIADAQVHLSDLTGKLADGTVRVGGDLDFRPEPAVLKFNVAAKAVDVQKLPAEWSLPKQLEGKLVGKADLVIRVPDHGPNVYGGGGAATIEGAKLAGLPAEVQLRLHGDGRRYRFQTADADQPPKKTASRSTGVRVRPPVRNARQEPPKKDAPAKKAADEPTTLDATITLRDVDIAELLTRLEVKVPYKLTGKVTVKASVSIPVAQADRTRTYRFAGSLTSPELTFEGLTVRDLSADVRYADGVLRLTSLRGKLPPETNGGGPGGFNGTATAAVQPRGDLTAALDLDRVPLGRILAAIPDSAIPVRGPVSGRAEFRAPLEKLSDPTTWVASATLRADELTAYERVVSNVVLPLKADAGTATLTAAKATIEGIPLAADARVTLTGPYRFEATAKTTAVQAADIRRLVPEVPLPFPIEGRLDLDAKLTGTASPLAFAATGTVKANELKVGTNAANKIDLAWAVDSERFKVTRLAADLFGGSVSGTADIPFDSAKAGRFDVAFKELDAATAAKAVPDAPVKLAGHVSGELKGTLLPAKPGQPRTPTADLDLTAPKLTVQGIPAERLTGKIGFANGAAEYHLEGRTLGGSFELKGRYPSRPKPAVPEQDRGSFNLRGADLRRAAEVFRVSSLGPLRGTIDLAFDFENDLSDGFGRLTVRDLAWGDTELANQLIGTVRLTEGALLIPDFVGTLAGGSLRGRVRVPLREADRNFFLVSVDRADPKRLFAPAPSLADAVTGPVSVTVRGRFGPDARGSGVVALDRGTVGGLQAADVRVPFDWATGVALTRVVVREPTARLGGGRVVGSVEYTAGATARLDGRLQFSDVRLSSVLGGFTAGGLLGAGRITGRFDFGGSPLRTADDLTGTLTATLQQTSVREIPILSVIAPYLSPVGVLRPFQIGEVRGRLSRGVFRLDRLALANPSAQLFAEGTITLAGRLDLDVVANTGRLAPAERAMRLFGLQLPVLGPVPITLIRDVSDFLSNRTVRLTVTGTTSNPQVRVNTAALLSEEAVRFFVGRYVPALATGSAAGVIAGGSNRR